LDDLDVPDHPPSMPVRGVMGHGIPPWWEPRVGTKEVAVPGAEARTMGTLSTAAIVANGHPLDGGVEAVGQGLEHFAASDAKEKGLVGGREVAAVAAAEAEHAGGVRDRLHHPPCVWGCCITVLDHMRFVLICVQVLVMVAPQPNRPGTLEQLHRRHSGGGSGGAPRRAPPVAVRWATHGDREARRGHAAVPDAGRWCAWPQPRVSGRDALRAFRARRGYYERRHNMVHGSFERW
jgi:hypothetical protein